MKKFLNILEWPTGKLDFSGGAIVMGVLNVTPDSFSDGGLYQNTDRAVTRGIEMAQQGAAIIDIGAESTRPGSESVSVEDQIARAVPVIEKLSQQIDIPITIDTTHPAVAEAALDAGAAIINDITALTDAAMTRLLVERNIPVILMHMQGKPRTMQVNPHYADVVTEVCAYLIERAKAAENAGVPRERIILDPGIGFGKTLEHNLQLLNRLDQLCNLGYRVLVGTSRKRFIGQITGKQTPVDRIFGTAATVALAIEKGASVIRVHDVAEMADVVKMSNAICRSKENADDR